MTDAVLIPGTLCDERVFAPMAEQLTISPWFAPPIAHADVVDEARAVLAAAPRRFVAIGYSLGGFVVLELLRHAPERLLGAVLIASNAEPLAPAAVSARRGEVALARSRGVDALVDRLWPRYVAAAHLGDRTIERIVRAMAHDTPLDSFAAQAEMAISRPDSRETLQTTRVPVLGLIGVEDVMIPPKGAQSIAAASTAQLVTLPGVGHFVPLEAPAAAAATIEAWVAEAVPCCSA